MRVPPPASLSSDRKQPSPRKPVQRLPGVFVFLAAAVMAFPMLPPPSPVKAQTAVEQTELNGIAPVLERLRGERFQAPPKAEFARGERMKQVILRQYDMFGVGPDYFVKAVKTLKALGFDPDGQLTEEGFADLVLEAMEEQVAGMYSPEDKVLYIAAPPDDAEKGKSRRPARAMERLREKALDRMGTSMKQIALFHELAHALQDQRHGLKGMFEAAFPNDDRLLAVSSLIEGEATLLTDMRLSELATGSPDGAGPDYGALLDSETLDAFLALTLGQEAEKLKKLPAILRVQLLFPYTAGAQFARALRDSGGWQRLDEAFSSPPQSVEQILHPEKYLSDPPEAPAPVPGFKPAPAIERGWTLVEENTLGELSLRFLLERWWKESGHRSVDTSETFRARGWGGDRYLIFQNSAGGLGYALVALWDTAEAAGSFQDAWKNWAEDGPAERPAQPDGDPARRGCQTRTEGRPSTFCRIDDRTVSVVEGLDEETTRALLEAAPFFSGAKESNGMKSAPR